MKKRLGLLGGGQLANLIASSAVKRDFEISAYCDSIDDPIVSLCQDIFVGERDDKVKLKNFFKSVDLVCLESEFFDVDLLVKLQKETGTKVYPELADYKKLYTKKNQKTLMDALGIDYAKTFDPSVEEDLQYPLVLKMSHGGYDGYGNKIVHSKEELDGLRQDPRFSNSFLEEKLDLRNEYACLLVKGLRDDFIFDPCLTVQQDQKCLFVEDGERVSSLVKMEIKERVQKISVALSGPGVYAFEFFETMDGRILFNEAAPRVHNSFHFSIEGYSHSQFDMFINAIVDSELYIPKRRYLNLTMLNIIGRDNGAYQLSFPYKEELCPYKIHMYGKKESRPGRKLGHITFFDNQNTTSESAHWVEKEYRL